MRKHNLAFVDIETTGINVLEHEIIEIGCVITDNDLNVLEEFEIKIKPDHIKTADPVALKVNRYSEKEWAEAISLKEAINIFSEKVKDCIMVGQNVSFDAGFLEYTFAKNNILNSMHYHKLDTISIAWAKFHQDIDFEHFSLREMCKRFDIKYDNPHEALADARATYELYKKLMSL